MTVEEGPVYTRGESYRARAEARQRRYRAGALSVGHGQYGHLLSPEAAAAGKNFILEEAFQAAKSRRDAGKGVAPRTFDNMLSSQAMCFNLFGPLATRRELAAELLAPSIEGLLEISAIHIEHTPAPDLLRDQRGRGGVDCDVLIEGQTTRGRLALVIETKFVEPKFSGCGFRKAGRQQKGLEVCPQEVAVGQDRRECLYVRKKGYAYWERTDQHRLLAPDALEPRGCPFGGELWQPWVNLALAHEEAARRGASDARFAVCVSPRNEALGAKPALDELRAHLRAPDSVALIDLDALLLRLGEVAPPELRGWGREMGERYGGGVREGPPSPAIRAAPAALADQRATLQAPGGSRGRSPPCAGSSPLTGSCRQAARPAQGAQDSARARWHRRCAPAKGG